MSNSQRRANPRIASSPDYVLLCGGKLSCEPTGALGLFYGGTTDMVVWVGVKSEALPLRGAGLASAERALKRRGYIVERVRVE